MKFATLAFRFIFASALVGCGVDPEALNPSSEPAVGAKDDAVETAKQPESSSKAEQIDVAKPKTSAATIDDESARGSIKVLFAAEPYPPCEAAENGEILFVEALGEFQVCKASVGGWVPIDLRGAPGAAGKDGADGVSGERGEKGEKGDEGDVGATGAEGAQGVQGVAGEKGETGATGAKGDKGDPGEAGPPGIQGVAGPQGAQGVQGIAGEAGAQGAAGLGAVGVWTSNDTLLGFSAAVSGSASVVFSGGGLADFNFGSGTFYGSYAYYGTNIARAQCLFLSTDCSGTCYAGSLSTATDGTVKGAVFHKGGQSWVKASGAETDAGSQTFRSTYVNGACSNAFGSVTLGKSFAVTTAWSLPSGLTMPLGKLYLSPAQ